MEFKENLKKLRLENNMTQKQVATIMNVAVSCYANWERGKYLPDLFNVIKLSKLFKVRVNYLFGLDDIRQK